MKRLIKQTLIMLLFSVIFWEGRFILSALTDQRLSIWIDQEKYKAVQADRARSRVDFWFKELMACKRKELTNLKRHDLERKGASQ